MHYLAGLFDAEGYISLIPSGHKLIGLEICHEESCQLFKDAFGGSISARKREKRRKSWIWTITDPTKMADFLIQMLPKCAVKQSQMVLMCDYLSFDRFYRKAYRPDYVHNIASLKKPKEVSKDFFKGDPLFISDEFIEWLAGFMDGDGTMTLYEYQNKREDKVYPTFDSFISVYNVHPQAIKYVHRHIPATITSFQTKSSTKNRLWKWVCRQKETEFVCKSLLPYLKLKKINAALILEYLEVKPRRIKGSSKPHTLEDQAKIRDLIKQIKHANSR